MVSDDRFAGVARVYGAQAMERLQNSHFCVVGLGGVGSWAVESLVRTGIGEITLIDLDDICISNTNRQSHAHEGNYGKSKVAAMAEQAERINPQLKINKIEGFLTEKSIERCFAGKPDGVIDAVDTVGPKCLMIRYCRKHKIPLIVSGGAGGQRDASQITFADLAKTVHDPLLSSVRKKLRKEFGYTSNPKKRLGVECIYSTEQAWHPGGDGEVSREKTETEGSHRLDCSSGYGAVAHVTASFGLLAVSRLIERLLQTKQK